MTSDWAEGKANEVLAKWYGTDPDEPGEGPTNAMLLSYLAQALREAEAGGLERAAKIAEAGWRYSSDPAKAKHLAALAVEIRADAAKDSTHE